MVVRAGRVKIWRSRFSSMALQRALTRASPSKSDGLNVTRAGEIQVSRLQRTDLQLDSCGIREIQSAAARSVARQRGQYCAGTAVQTPAESEGVQASAVARQAASDWQ